MGSLSSLFTTQHDIDIKGWIIKEITNYLCAKNKTRSTFWEEIANKNSIQIISINSTGKQYENIEDLELSVRTTNALIAAGINTVDGLRKRFNEEGNTIREIAHFGNVAYEEVQDKLTEISASPGSYDISRKIRKDAPIGIRVVRENESVAYRFVNHSIESIGVCE